MTHPDPSDNSRPALSQAVPTPEICPLRGTGPKAWLRRIGIFGFLFFLAKGLMWLSLIMWAMFR